MIKRRRKNTKLTGERSEAAFLSRAAALGFGVAKPWGDSRRYDFILDNGTRLWRIQVQCTECIRAQAYETRATYTVGKGRAVYPRRHRLAAHVVPLDIWYIIPIEICTPAPMLRFYPHRQAKKMRLEPYREAWYLLTSPADSKPRYGLEIQASADEAMNPNIVIPSESQQSCHSEEQSSEEPAFSAADKLPRFTWLTPRPIKPIIIPRDVP